MLPPSTHRRHLLATTLLLLVVGGGLSVMTAQEAAKPPAAKSKGKDKGEAGKPSAAVATPPAAPTQGLIPFGKMLPIGKEHEGLEIPSFKNGAPSSTVRAASMTRLDDENMFLKKMDIRMFGPPTETEKDMRVQLKTATYHMPSNVIASEERSRISRADFDLQGDSLVFDTATGQGKMVGNVTMILHDSSSFAKIPGEKPKGAPAKDDAEKKEKETSPAGTTPDPSTPAPKAPAGASPTNPKK
ncbi:MAG TPA: hypothetical protein VLE43_17210 [Candidatus Saccharimonadia bacterium]|nr:hypothetical protein [Candidatus Saccharimonadia bacterium]